jgi:toxin ParE1/3/4
MRVRLLPAAKAEADEAADWYAAREPDSDLHTRFLAEVKRVGRLIGERPHAWSEVEPGVRRAVLRRFPYSLIYSVAPNEVLVLAIAHHSREPGYWRDR